VFIGMFQKSSNKVKTRLFVYSSTNQQSLITVSLLDILFLNRKKKMKKYKNCFLSKNKCIPLPHNFYKENVERLKYESHVLDKWTRG
jgi:hypothetical protein